MAGSRLASRTMIVRDRRTSVRLEPELWDVLETIAAQKAMAAGELVADIDKSKPSLSPLTSAIRVFIVLHLMELHGMKNL